jgi:hypothetical protein
VWVQLPPGMSAAQLEQQCADTVSFLPGPLATVAGALSTTAAAASAAAAAAASAAAAAAASGAIAGACDSCIRLCFAKASLTELQEGARRLAAVINALLGDEPPAVAVSADAAAPGESLAVANTAATAGSSGTTSGSTAAADAPSADITDVRDDAAAAESGDSATAAVGGSHEEEDDSDVTQWHDCATTDEAPADTTAVTTSDDVAAVTANTSTPTAAAATAAATGTATAAGASGSGNGNGATEGVPKQHSHKPSLTLDILPDTVHTAPAADSAAATAAAVAAVAVKSGSPKSGSSSAYASPSSAAVRTTKYMTEATPARSPRSAGSTGKRVPYVPSPGRMAKYWMHEVPDTADTSAAGTSTAAAAAAGGAASREYTRVGSHRALETPPQSPQRGVGRSYYGTPCGSPLRERARALHMGDAREEGEIHVLLNLMSRQMRAEVEAGRVGVTPNLPAPPASPK